jgi:hypothetical protein
LCLPLLKGLHLGHLKLLKSPCLQGVNGLGFKKQNEFFVIKNNWIGSKMNPKPKMNFLGGHLSFHGVLLPFERACPLISWLLNVVRKFWQHFMCSKDLGQI